jgi:hypothetical protein
MPTYFLVTLLRKKKILSVTMADGIEDLFKIDPNNIIIPSLENLLDDACHGEKEDP